MELQLKHRPAKFSEVIGQVGVMKALNEMGKKGEIPHTMLFTGPSGTGKTTIARILKKKLECHDVDFIEMNGSDNRGIDDMRKILRTVNTAPMSGKCRIWLIDEAHALTGDAQNCILKVIEEPPKHVYFMLCTTDPQKLKRTIITRCTEFRCRALYQKELVKLVQDIAIKEEKPVEDEVAETIARCSDGSARQAVKILNSVIGLDTEAQLEAVRSQDLVPSGVHLGRLLMDDKTTWPKMQEALKKVEGEPEQIRHAVMGYAKAVLLGKGDLSRAAAIIDRFQDHFFDSKMPGLILACYDVIHQ